MLNVVDQAEQFMKLTNPIKLVSFNLSKPYGFVEVNMARACLMAKLFAAWYEAKTEAYFNAIHNLSEVKEDNKWQDVKEEENLD